MPIKKVFKITAVSFILSAILACKLNDNSLLAEGSSEDSLEPSLSVAITNDDGLISSANKSNYTISGTCSNVQTVNIQVGPVSGSTSCTNDEWSVQFDLSAIDSDPVSLVVIGVKNSSGQEVTDQSTLRKKFEPSAIRLFAGDSLSAGSTDGVGAGARFTHASGMTSDGTHLFVTDRSLHVIKKIVIASKEVTTISGTPGVSGVNNGAMSAATFNGAVSLTYDSGNLYIADTENHRIRKINLATEMVETFAGDGITGSIDGTGTAARFNRPHSIISDGEFLWVSDTTNRKIRRIHISTRVVTTFAGSGVVGTADGIGTAATFNWPNSITIVGNNLYVQEIFRHCIRQISKTTAQVTTVAGLCGTTGITDGVGTSARFNRPAYITTDGMNLFVTDFNNSTVRQISLATMGVTTLSGTPGVSGHADGLLAAATFTNSVSTFYFSNRLYILAATYIREIF